METHMSLPFAQKQPPISWKRLNRRKELDSERRIDQGAITEEKRFKVLGKCGG